MPSGDLIAVVRAGDGDVREELVAVTREGIETTIRFDDGLRLRFNTGQLLNAVLDEKVLTELVESVLEKAAAAVKRGAS
jgi:hypothetical protein